MPAPNPVFDQIETVCIIVFTFEFLARFFTSFAMRSELLQEAKVIEMVCCDEQTSWLGPSGRALAFIKDTSNIIDVLAIAPFFIEMFVDAKTNLMVLRLVRLTRMFRVLRLGKLSDSMDVLVDTFFLSLPSLYVLTFYICLGVLVASSIVYFLEQGKWDSETGKYLRIDALSGELDESPFVSIPDTFWWTIVTVTTVGYGDLFPTTSLGKLFGAITILGGVTVFAMPVGVIASNFTRVYEENQQQKMKATTYGMSLAEAEEHTIENAFDETGVARSLLKFEVYDHDGVGSEPRFLGQAVVDLALMGWDSQTASGTCLPMKLERNKRKSRKECRGNLKVNLLWEPHERAVTDRPAERFKSYGKLNRAPKAQVAKDSLSLLDVTYSFWGRPLTPELNGSLSIEVVGADSLRKTNKINGGFCDPFFRVTVFPKALDPQAPPEVWTSAIVNDNTCPQWNEFRSYVLDWSNPKNIHSSFSECGGSSKDMKVESVPAPLSMTATMVDLKLFNFDFLRDPKTQAKLLVAELEREMQFMNKDMARD
jgi:voltage-gated potassium channel Kch